MTSKKTRSVLVSHKAAYNAHGYYDHILSLNYLFFINSIL